MNKKSTNSKLKRRHFLELCAGVGVAGAAISVGSHPFQQVNASAAANMAPSELIPSTCNMCVNRCGIQCKVVAGVVEKIDGDPRNPKSRGGTCAKGQAGIMAAYDPDRIQHPMIRVGKRGEGKWRKASWEEAYEYVAENLTKIIKKHGPESLLFSSSTDLTETFFVKLGKYMGTPNFARHATLCLASRNVGYFATMGGVPDADLVNSRYIIMYGANRLESFEIPYNIDLTTALAKGAKLVVVDPRLTHTATKGEWIPIRPGTDMALNLALMHVLINENLYNKTFVTNLTTGFEALKNHVQQYTPEWAAKETDIPAASIVQMARDMAKAAPHVVIFPGRRSSWYTNDSQFRRTLPMLMALLGAFDVEGASFYNNGKVKLGKFEWEMEPFEIAERADGFDAKTFPLAHHGDGGYVHLRDAIVNGKTQYPVKGWMIYKQNPLASVVDSNKTLKMMAQMDFICAIDVQPSQTASMADIILPETTYLERLDPIWSPGTVDRYIGIRQPVIKPQYESKTILEIIKGLARSLDKRHEFDTPLTEAFNFSMEDYIDAQLAPLPVDRQTLMKEGIWLAPEKKIEFGAYLSGQKKFKTPSGKIELVAERFRRNGYDALPIYHSPKTEAGKQRLVTGRYAWFTHAANQNNPWLHAITPENDVWINPDVAAEKGIKSGDLVLVKSRAGETRIKAKVTPRIRKDTVFICHGFGSDAPGQTIVNGKGGADQVVMESHADEISNNQALHETFVDLIKI